MSYDPTRRRQALRKQRERGCSIYISQEVLKNAGFNNGELPYYRTWAGRKSKGVVLVQLYEKGEE